MAAAANGFADQLISDILTEVETKDPRPRRRGLKGDLGPPLKQTLPEEWVFPPSVSEADYQGRTVALSLKVPGTLADAASSLIGRRGIPYESVKHLAVDGILLVTKLAMARLADADPRILAAINAEELAREQRMLQANIQQLVTTVATLEENLTNLVGHGFYDAAQQALRRQELLLARNPDPEWRSRMQHAVAALPIVKILYLLEPR